MKLLCRDLERIKPGFETAEERHRQVQEQILSLHENDTPLEHILNSKQLLSLQDEMERQKRILELSMDQDLVKYLQQGHDVQTECIKMKEGESKSMQVLFDEKIKEVNRMTSSETNQDDDMPWWSPKKHLKSIMTVRQKDAENGLGGISLSPRSTVDSRKKLS